MSIGHDGPLPAEHGNPSSAWQSGGLMCHEQLPRKDGIKLSSTTGWRPRDTYDVHSRSISVKLYLHGASE
jgi:hypothetical protein